MKRLIPVLAIVLGWATAAWPLRPATLTSVRAISALSDDEARQKLPVAFEATVTYYRDYEHQLFVQDGDLAIFVYLPTKDRIAAGDRVLIKGTTRASFHAIVASNDITVLGHGPMPKPFQANFNDLILGKHDCLLVTMRGVVHAADLALSQQAPIRSITLEILTSGGYIKATIDSDNLSSVNGLLDAEIEITGASGGKFDSKMQQTGILLHVPSMAYLKVLKLADLSIWKTPATSLENILAGYQDKDLSKRIRVQGTITYYQPGSVVVLQKGGRSLWIRTGTGEALRIGDLAEATGFPDVINGFLTLTHSEVIDLQTQAPIAPLPVTWQELADSADRGTGHHHDLVSIEGQVVTEAREGAQDEYVVVSGGHPFSAIYQRPTGPAPPMKDIPLGAKVRVIGICTLHDANPFGGPVAFDIMLRSFDDIDLVSRPSMLNTRNLTILVVVLLVIVAFFGARGWALERSMRRQTAAMSVHNEAEAELERQRSRILEDINGSRPLFEILGEIAEMVSSTLDGAPCWCEIGDGSTIGECPKDPRLIRFVQVNIEARTGPVLGTLYAGIDPKTPLADRETEALNNGARLATLAIETRRLYSDLRRRSEFDLLTDIPNRFAMERFIELQIKNTCYSDGKLALIYIDLDNFKPINDTYGHHVGDVFLQSVALRMSRQLPGSDMLARLGGDEFAALVSLHNGQSDLDHIIARLEHCFEEPFVVEGTTLHGSASLGVALYPENGLTKDCLLSAADAAMYAVKNARRKSAEKTPPASELELTASVSN
jgi:diguanylate cyclase (GGDEF)-like protein